jgi:hypothetical protein
MFPVLRSVDGWIRRKITPEGTALELEIYNINAQPLIPYATDPNDRITLKIIYAARKALDTPDALGEKPRSVKLRISHFANKDYAAALQKWGFQSDGENALAVTFKREDLKPK